MRNNIKNPKLKTLFSRLLAITLAIATVITTIPPTEAHASEVEDAAKNKGFGGVMPSPGDAWMGWYNQTQGYRIYMINSRLERITPVYDFYFRSPYSFYKGVASDYNVNYMKTTRFDSMPEDYYIDWIDQDYTIDKLVEWCSAKDAPPYPYKSSKPYAGQGDKFRDWFYAGQEGTTLKGYDSSGGGTGVTAKDGEGKVEKNDDFKIETSPAPTGKPENKCADCQGSGTSTMTCPACAGNGTYLTAGSLGSRIECPICSGSGNLTIKCSTCKDYTCDTCKDTKLCMKCGGKKHILVGIACQDCYATGECQDCKYIGVGIAGSGLVTGDLLADGKYSCTTCQSTRKITCTTCKGTGKSPLLSLGSHKCPSCIGLKEINCPDCSLKASCTKCGVDITRYSKSNTLCVYCTYTENHDGNCNDCNGKCELDCTKDSSYALDCYFTCNDNETCITCTTGAIEEVCGYCGSLYWSNSTCTYCKCPICKSQMTQLNNVYNWECTKCARTVIYNTSSSTVKVSIPDSYWLPTSKLKTATKAKINLTNAVIEQLKDYNASNWNLNQATYASINTLAKKEITNQLNAKFNDKYETPISPYDALLYATGVVLGQWQSSFTSSTTDEYRQGVYYSVYKAMQDIQLSQDYKDLYYTELPLTTASHSITNQYASLLTTQIPLSGTDPDKVSKTPAINLINSGYIEFPDGDYMADEESGKTAMQLAMEDGCLIVVEPLCGFRMKLGEENGAPLWGKYWAYGSFWNIAQHWYGTKESYYSTFLTNLTNNCLVTGSDFTTKDGYTIFAPENPNRKIDIQESKKMMSSLTLMYEGLYYDDNGEQKSTNPIQGLSMHLYSMDVSETLTWDEELINENITEENPYPFEIGPSPDHTDRVAEEKRSDPTKYANIVKFYETTDPATGETTYEVFSREIVPRKIEIVDESAETGYKLIEWYTTDKLCDNLDNPEITWNKVLSNDGYDRGNLGQHSACYIWKTGVPECILTMGLIPKGEGAQPGYDVMENTLYLLYRVGDATTSTYDELLEDQIGPSPDDTHKLIERTNFEAAVLDDKYINDATIVKIYEELDSVGNIISTEVFTRELVPNTIGIEDESEQTGYILTDWFTGSKYIAFNHKAFKGETYQDFYDFYSEYWIRNLKVYINRKVSVEYTTEEEYNSNKEELFQILSFIDEDGMETGEQVLYLHYIKVPNTLAVTSTYDPDPTYPSTTPDPSPSPTQGPGPAPDDSDLLTDEQIDADEYINIVKFYETYVDEVLTTHAVYTRTPAPMIVHIMNEIKPVEDESAEDATQFTITDWFTSDIFTDIEDTEDLPLDAGSYYDNLKDELYGIDKVNEEGIGEQIVSFTEQAEGEDIALKLGKGIADAFPDSEEVTIEMLV